MSALELTSYDDADSLSVIPYDTHRDIVLRHANSVVEFDPESRQLILRNRARNVETRSPTRGDCPTCGRPWNGELNTPSQSPSMNATDEQPSFINNDYFRLLARSLPSSRANSRPPSPRRRFIQPDRSRLASPPIVPPPDAEFVGSAPAPPSPTHGISETAFAQQYFEKFFTIEKELGKGGRGVVLLVKHVLDNVTLGHFACKRVPIGDDHAWLEKVLVEVQALQCLSHQNLVSYRHVWLEDYQLNNFGPSVPCAFILQQYCNGGDLHNYVCGSAKVLATTQELKDRIRRRSKGEREMPRKPNEPKKLPFDEIYSFFRDITSGLRFLHLNGFIHRDLKPSNCLLHTVGGETRVLVSDFGEVQYEHGTRRSTGATGTISYCAPEVLRKEKPDGPFGNFSFKSDIFSLGMILHFLCFATLPYRHADVLHEEREDLAELRAEIVSWIGFDDHKRMRPELPAKLYSFMKRLLSLNPDNRPTADEVNHGIRLGGLDQVPEMRRRKSVSPEELSPGRRIQNLETATRGEVLPYEREFPKSEPNSHLRRRAPSVEPRNMIEGVEKHSEAIIDDDELASESMLDQSPSAVDQSKSQLTALVPTPPAQSVPSSPRRPSNHLDQQRPVFLLPAPPPRGLFSNFISCLQLLPTLTIRSPAIRVAMLAIKIFTILQPCISNGMNASIVYPLLVICVIEFTVYPLQVWKASVALLVHVSVLWYTLSTGMLCRSATANRHVWLEGDNVS